MSRSEPINWINVAAQMWPILTAAAADNHTLSYKELGDEIGLHHRSVKFALDVIYRYCRDAGLPPLTGIVLRQDSGTPGVGFTAWDRNDLESGLAGVYAENWAIRPNPFIGFGGEDTVRSMVDRIVEAPDESGEVYRQVRDRGIAQQIFRQGLLRAYDHRCAMCDLSFEAALEAAHIIQFWECAVDLRMNITNGLLLCASHHRLFEDECFSFESDYTILYYDPDLADGPYSESDRFMASNLHGKKLRLPKSKRHWPVFPRMSPPNAKRGA